MKRQVVSAAAMALACGSAASAQTIYTTRIDDGAAEVRAEMALRVSRTTRDAMAAWIQPAATGIIPRNRLHYNASGDGSSWRSSSAEVPRPQGEHPYGADPFIAFKYDGIGRVGYVGWNPDAYGPNQPAPDRFIIAEKPVGDEYADDPFAVIIETDVVDKPVFAPGPPMGGGSDIFGLVFLNRDDYQAIHPIELRSMPAPPGTHYLVNTEPVTQGNPTGANRDGPNALLILRNADSMEGRWVLATYHGVCIPNDPPNCNCRTAQNPNPPNPCATGVRPRASWSPDGTSGPNNPSNRQWFPSVSPEHVTKRGTAAEREPIIWFAGEASTFAGPAVYNYPYLAADQTDERTVYMSFLGKAQSSSSGTNIDIMIARSPDGGQNFSGPTNDRGQYVLRLTDAELGDPEGAWQFFPSITVDTWGTVHVLYYVGNPPAPGSEAVWTYQIKLASISNFDVSSPTVSVLNVFPEDPENFHLEHSLVPLENGRFLGHYMDTLDSRVCELYAGYIARAPNSSGGPGAYVSRIVLDNRPDCFPDPECYANCDESTTVPVLNVQDFTCFLQKYSQGCASPTTGPGGVGPCYPNCDQSTSSPFLNVADFICFMQRYVQGCQ